VTDEKREHRKEFVERESEKGCKKQKVQTKTETGDKETERKDTRTFAGARAVWPSGVGPRCAVWWE
jgi:hypothetical protein